MAVLFTRRTSLQVGGTSVEAMLRSKLRDTHETRVLDRCIHGINLKLYTRGQLAQQPGPKPLSDRAPSAA